MTRDDIQKLLGGYATGTLTPEEEQALFAAALDDQELFDALAREQTLRDLLRDPAAKAQLLAAIDETDRAIRVPWYRRYAFGLTAAAACAAALVAFIALRPAPRAVRTVAVAVSANPVKMLAQTETRPSGGPSQAAADSARPEIKRRPRAKVTEMAKAEPLPAEPLPAARPAVPPSPPVPPPPGTAVGTLAQTVEVTGAAPAFAAPGSPEATRLQGQQGAQAGVGGARDVTGGFLPQPGSQPAGQQSSQIQLASQAGQQQAGDNLLIQPGRASAGLAMSAGGGGGAGPLLTAPSAKVLRQDADGGFTEADASNLHAGDTVKLSLIPTADGYLSVMGSAPGPSNFQPLINQRVERLKPIETQPFQQNEAGQREYVVVFSRAPQAVQRDENASARLLKTVAPLMSDGRGGKGGGAAAAKDQVADANKAEAAHSASAPVANAPRAAPGPLPLRMSQAPPLRIILIYK